MATAPDPETVPAVEELPGPVAQTFAAIQLAASAQDYDALEPLVEAESFLSDAGFGVDPVTHWRELGTEPLEAMAGLLAMPHTVEETNEGTLYRWPRFTADSDPDDMSAAEKDALTMLLGESGLEPLSRDRLCRPAPGNPRRRHVVVLSPGSGSLSAPLTEAASFLCVL